MPRPRAIEHCDIEYPTMPPAARVEDLSPTLQIVARLVAIGFSDREIGKYMSRSPLTARYHVHRIYSILGINRRAVLCRWAIRAGLLQEEMERPAAGRR